MLPRTSVEEVKASIRFDERLVETILHPNHVNHHYLNHAEHRDFMVSMVSRRVNPAICAFVEEKCLSVPKQALTGKPKRTHIAFSLRPESRRFLEDLLRRLYERAGHKPEKTVFTRAHRYLCLTVQEVISRISVVRRFVD